MATLIIVLSFSFTSFIIKEAVSVNISEIVNVFFHLNEISCFSKFGASYSFSFKARWSKILLEEGKQASIFWIKRRVWEKLMAKVSFQETGRKLISFPGLRMKQLHNSLWPEVKAHGAGDPITQHNGRIYAALGMRTSLGQWKSEQRSLTTPLDFHHLQGSCWYKRWGEGSRGGGLEFCMYTSFLWVHLPILDPGG